MEDLAPDGGGSGQVPPRRSRQVNQTVALAAAPGVNSPSTMSEISESGERLPHKPCLRDGSRRSRPAWLSSTTTCGAWRQRLRAEETTPSNRGAGRQTYRAWSISARLARGARVLRRGFTHDAARARRRPRAALKRSGGGAPLRPPELPEQAAGGPWRSTRRWCGGCRAALPRASSCLLRRPDARGPRRFSSLAKTVQRDSDAGLAHEVRNALAP
jgi:hypothetical protein